MLFQKFLAFFFSISHHNLKTRWSDCIFHLMKTVSFDWQSKNNLQIHLFCPKYSFDCLKMSSAVCDLFSASHESIIADDIFFNACSCWTWCQMLVCLKINTQKIPLSLHYINICLKQILRIKTVRIIHISAFAPRCLPVTDGPNFETKNAK